MNRREFLRDICAASVAMGAPARIWGAAAKAGTPDLRIGVLSDIHLSYDGKGFLTQPTSWMQANFIKALEYFRARHVDAVLVSGEALGADLCFSVAAADVKKGGFSDAARRAKGVAPEFDAEAKVSVAERRGKTRKKRACDQFVVSFPTVKSKAGRPRAYEYRVCAIAADGTKLAETKVHSPFVNCAESHEPTTSTCVLEKTAELAAEGVRFTVEPLDCWGNAGRGIRS